MDRLDAIVAKHDINLHPFYRAWREGTLSRGMLAQYAADYAPFIQAVESGWRSLGDENHAEVERQHALLWDTFRSSLAETERAPLLPPAPEPSSDAGRALEAEARDAFSDPVTAIGALYAFEAQQPKTARSKLDGLMLHYASLETSTAYFHAHADDYGEREELGARAAALAPRDLARAEAACERLCRGMWALLDGVMTPVVRASNGLA
jgi:pyrroloquinoline-quinone synthase